MNLRNFKGTFEFYLPNGVQMSIYDEYERLLQQVNASGYNRRVRISYKRFSIEIDDSAFQGPAPYNFVSTLITNTIDVVDLNTTMQLVEKIQENNDKTDIIQAAVDGIKTSAIGIKTNTDRIP